MAHLKRRWASPTNLFSMFVRLMECDQRSTTESPAQTKTNDAGAIEVCCPDVADWAAGGWRPPLAPRPCQCEAPHEAQPNSNPQYHSYLLYVQVQYQHFHNRNIDKVGQLWIPDSVQLSDLSTSVTVPLTILGHERVLLNDANRAPLLAFLSQQGWIVRRRRGRLPAANTSQLLTCSTETGLVNFFGFSNSLVSFIRHRPLVKRAQDLPYGL